MVEWCMGGYWAITHFNLFIADIPLTRHMHTPEKHEQWQQQDQSAMINLILPKKKRTCFWETDLVWQEIILHFSPFYY